MPDQNTIIGFITKVSVIVTLFSYSLHVVEEGYVGVYFRVCIYAYAPFK